MEIRQSNILKGPFWPEKVRVISVKSTGENQLRIEAVGLEAQRFYNPNLSLEDSKSVQVIEERPFQFTADGESLFLFFQSHRIRSAFQFDPLYAVNVSQMAPLPPPDRSYLPLHYGKPQNQVPSGGCARGCLADFCGKDGWGVHHQRQIVIKDPEIQNYTAARNFFVEYLPPEQFGDFCNKERSIYRPVLERAGI